VPWEQDGTTGATGATDTGASWAGARPAAGLRPAR